MIAYYNRLNSRGTLLLYTFDSQKGLERKIIFQEAWIQMIQDQMTAILGWIQYERYAGCRTITQKFQALYTN